MDSFEKFNKILPSKDKFYSTLTEKNISDKDDQHVKVWKVSETKNVKHYHNFYLAFDVIFNVMLRYVIS